MKTIEAMEISKITSHNITSLRHYRGMSIIALAKKCGLARDTIYKLESGQSIPTQKTAKLLAKALKVEEHVLFQINPIME